MGEVERSRVGIFAADSRAESSQARFCHGALLNRQAPRQERACFAQRGAVERCCPWLRAALGHSPALLATDSGSKTKTQRPSLTLTPHPLVG